MIVPSIVTATENQQCFIVQNTLSTFHFLPLLVADVPCDFHGVANECIATSMMHSPLNGWFILNDIYRQPCAFGERSELVVYRLDLDGIQRNKRRLSRSLVTHVLYREIGIAELNRFQ